MSFELIFNNYLNNPVTVSSTDPSFFNNIIVEGNTISYQSISIYNLGNEIDVTLTLPNGTISNATLSTPPYNDGHGRVIDGIIFTLSSPGGCDSNLITDSNTGIYCLTGYTQYVENELNLSTTTTDTLWVSIIILIIVIILGIIASKTTFK